MLNPDESLARESKDDRKDDPQSLARESKDDREDDPQTEPQTSCPEVAPKLTKAERRAKNRKGVALSLAPQQREIWPQQREIWRQFEIWPLPFRTWLQQPEGV